MSLSQTLASYVSARDNIRNALVNKGVSAASAHGFYSFATDIANIPAGSDTFEPRVIGTMSTVYENSTATTIASGAFYWFSYTSGSAVSYDLSVTIPNATVIGTAAFGYTGLSIASFPNVTEIHPSAFDTCRSLHTAIFPSVTSIGNYAFNMCTSLATLSVPSVETIGDYAFTSVPITEVSFPACTSVGNYAFTRCASITNVSLPSCTYIGERAFAGTNVLTTAYIPRCSILGNGAFGNCIALQTVDLTSCVTIGEMAFYSCGNLNNITAPKCEYVNSGAFFGCTNLTNISLLSCKAIRDSAFSGCTAINSINLPSCSIINNMAFVGCTNLAEVRLGGTDSAVGVIQEYAFAGTALESLYISTNSEDVIELIDTNAFEDTPIGDGTGHIYITASMVDAYKEAENWSNFSSIITAM